MTDQALEVLTRHGVLLVTIWVFAVQVGVPIPTVALLLGVGALAGFGKLSLGGTLLAAIGGSLVAGLFWYTVGRRFGNPVLDGLCRISRELDSCVHWARNGFAGRPFLALLAGKFLFELNAVVAALAGSSGIRLGEFLVLEVASTLLWAGTWMGIGYVVRDSVREAAALLGWFGPRSVVLLAAVFGGYLAVKYVRRPVPR